MRIPKTELQIRSETLDSIERVLSLMNLSLQNSTNRSSTDPLKGTLNRIEFEVLLARNRITHSEDPRPGIKQGRLAKVLQFAR